MAQNKEYGVTGLIRFAGVVFEEQLIELQGYRWPKIVKSMSESSSIVGGFLYAIEMLCRQTDWPIVPTDETNADDKEAAAFIQECIDDLELSWQDTLAEILTFLPWGWAVMEKVLKKRPDGQIGWLRWGSRAQETLFRWEFDDIGTATAMVQWPPPDYIQRTIPLDKCLHFRTKSHKGNPEGKSILRTSYLDWYNSTNIKRIEAIGIERDLAGFPVAKIPSSVITAGGDVLKNWEDSMANIRRDEQEFLIIPSDTDEKGHPLYAVELLASSGKRQFDTDKIIRRYETRMMQAVLADFMMLGHEGVGSYALSSDKTKLFSVSIGGFMDTICQTINRHGIDELLAMNGYKGKCQMTHGDLEKVPLDSLAAIFNMYDKLQIALTDEEKAWVKRQSGFPKSDIAQIDDNTDGTAGQLDRDGSDTDVAQPAPPVPDVKAPVIKE